MGIQVTPTQKNNFTFSFKPWFSLLRQPGQVSCKVQVYTIGQRNACPSMCSMLASFQKCLGLMDWLSPKYIIFAPTSSRSLNFDHSILSSLSPSSLKMQMENMRKNCIYEPPLGGQVLLKLEWFASGANSCLSS